VTDAHKRLFFVMSAGVYAAAGLDLEAFRHHPRIRSARQAIGRSARAGLSRGGSIVRHRRELAGLENRAFVGLAQNLVGSAGAFDRGKSSWIFVHARASDGGQINEVQRRFAAH
jgi:hypothetical protein